jgi:hypothetical protein
MPGPVCVGEERRSNSYCSEPDEEGDGEEGGASSRHLGANLHVARALSARQQP